MEADGIREGKHLKGMSWDQPATKIGLNDEWLTPPEILHALGPFDLDPCAPVNCPWEMAVKHYSIIDMGLMQPWKGRVWLNPPYGLEAAEWLARLAEHGDGIALIFARTETDMFRRYVWEKADGVFFFYGRLFFHHVDGRRAEANAGAPSCLVAYGQKNVEAIENSKLSGRLVKLKEH